MISPEKVLELINLFFDEYWTLIEIKMGELGLHSEDLAEKLKEKRSQQDEIKAIKQKLGDEILVGNNRKKQWQATETKLQTEITEKQQKITELETNLQTEREVHQAALETSRVWHERQKAELKEQHTRELTEAQELISKLQQDNRDLLNDIHQYKQKNTTHEQTITHLNQEIKTHEETIEKLQQKHQDYLTQEKSFLQRGIQLIKEVLHD